jgi:hypothetical protein
LHGEWFAFVRGLTQRYLTYFSPNILFVEGDYSPRHNIPDMGILNYYSLIFIPFGFYLLWRKKENERKIIIYWLFTASIPAILSRDLISMVRALNLTLPWTILTGFGFYYLANKLPQIFHLKKIIFTSLLLSIVAINLFLYLDLYFIHLSKEDSKGWLYGYKQTINTLGDLSKYDRVVFTDFYGQPYIYYLFYKKYPPEKFQSQAILDQKTVDVGTVRHIDNLEFRPINWPVDRGLENTLLIGADIEIPEQDIITEKKSKKISEIKFLDGKTAFRVVENGYDEK